MLEKIEAIRAITRLKLGMAVSLLKNANLITYEDIAGLTFGELEEICQTGADKELKEILLQTMEKRAADLGDWKKIYELSPRGQGDSFRLDRERRKNALLKMMELAGTDFEKLYIVWELPGVGGRRIDSDFLDIASKIEGRICRDCFLTHEQALRLLDNESRDSELWRKAYQWMTEFVKKEFKDTAN
ncbi:MAG TPA: hypothetical protein VF390_02025 [Patescibacteria group bacterium]